MGDSHLPTGAGLQSTCQAATPLATRTKGKCWRPGCCWTGARGDTHKRGRCCCPTQGRKWHEVTGALGHDLSGAGCYWNPRCLCVSWAAEELDPQPTLTLRSNPHTALSPSHTGGSCAGPAPRSSWGLPGAGPRVGLPAVTLSTRPWGPRWRLRFPQELTPFRPLLWHQCGASAHGCENQQP